MSDENVLRQFNTAGIARFRQWLTAARGDPHLELPTDLLTADDVTEVVEPIVTLERPGFATKQEAAVYLHDALAPMDADDVLRNAGLWTWLTLYYFDDVCPPTAGGRKVFADYFYIYLPDDFRLQARHLLRVSFEVLRRAPDHHRLLLLAPVPGLSKLIERVMGQLFLARIDSIFEVMDRLYFDEKTNRAKRGLSRIGHARPGDMLNRLPRRIQQLQRTYDLNVVDADRLIELLGPEFQAWENDAKLPGMK
jgi:hypothetical protein